VEKATWGVRIQPLGRPSGGEEKEIIESLSKRPKKPGNFHNVATRANFFALWIYWVGVCSHLQFGKSVGKWRARADGDGEKYWSSPAPEWGLLGLGWGSRWLFMVPISIVRPPNMDFETFTYLAYLLPNAVISNL
jgi:hypothetical protein